MGAYILRRLLLMIPFGLIICVSDYQLPVFWICAARFRHAVHLVFSGCETDVRVESAGRGRHQVHRDRRFVFRVGIAQRLDARRNDRVGRHCEWQSVDNHTGKLLAADIDALPEA